MNQELNNQNKRIIQNIAERRASSSRRGAIIVTTVGVAAFLLADDLLPVAVLLFLLATVTVLYGISRYNLANSENLSTGYRLFNKVVYRQLSFVWRIFSVFLFIKSVASFLNPLSGFKDPSYSKSDDAFNILGAGVGLSVSNRNLKEAKQVEWAYAALNNDVNIVMH